MEGWKLGSWEDLFYPSNLPTASQTLPRFAFLFFSRLLFNLTYVLAVLRPVPATLSMLVCPLQ